MFRLNLRDVFYLISLCLLTAVVLHSEIQCPQHVFGVFKTGFNQHPSMAFMPNKIKTLEDQVKVLRRNNEILDVNLAHSRDFNERLKAENSNLRKDLVSAKRYNEELDAKILSLRTDPIKVTETESIDPPEVIDEEIPDINLDPTSLVEDEGEKTIDEEEEEDEEDDEDEEDPLTSTKGYEIVVQGGATTFQLNNQVSATSKMLFKVQGTKFLGLISSWEHAGWKRIYHSGSSLILTKPVTKIPGSYGKLINQVSRSSCIGGSKGAQLRCKKTLAEEGGCDFVDLHISPGQFNLHFKPDCEKFFSIAGDPDNVESKMWILKDGGSYHGKGMKIYQGLKHDVKKKYGKCSKNKETGAGYIMQEYIGNPALLGGKKFDIRSFLLIASTHPFLIYYHKGFARRSAIAYSNSNFNKLGHITNHKSQDKHADHFVSFSNVSRILESESGFPSDFMDTVFKKRAKHVTNYIFQAARSKIKRRIGAFMVFGVDWVLDGDQGVHFLEANGNPSISNYPGTDLGPRIWNEMAYLVSTLHRTPELVAGGSPRVREGHAHGGWELVFNEAEEAARGDVYAACEFPSYISQCDNSNKCERW